MRENSESMTISLRFALDVFLAARCEWWEMRLSSEIETSI